MSVLKLKIILLSEFFCISLCPRKYCERNKNVPSFIFGVLSVKSTNSHFLVQMIKYAGVYKMFSIPCQYFAALYVNKTTKLDFENLLCKFEFL